MGRHRVVIIRCGFGGLFAARSLRHANVDVTVIDRTCQALESQNTLTARPTSSRAGA